MDIFEVIVYINKEIESQSFYQDLESALKFANYCEDKGYICEVHRYEYCSTVRRGFWRNEKPDDATEISI